MLPCEQIAGSYENVCVAYSDFANSWQFDRCQVWIQASIHWRSQ